jgi:nucleoside-diphosphate-sugar epimerase
MSTLITGGSGFIGSHLSKILIERGERPVILDISLPGPILQSAAGKFDFKRGSLSNISTIINCVQEYGVKRIFHLGGMLSLPSEQNPWEAFDTNILGTYNILEAARIKEVEQVIFGSSIAAFSKDIQGSYIDDVTIQRPTSMYGTTKVCGELLGLYYARRFGLDFRGLRIPSVVGPGAKTAHMSIYNAWAIEYSLKGQPYTLECKPETRCPVIYFKDLLRALDLLSAVEKEGLSALVYNLAGISPPFSAQELVDEINKLVPSAELIFKPDPNIAELLKELGSLEIKDDCARKEWGWQIKYPLAEMVADFAEEFKKHQPWYL